MTKFSDIKGFAFDLDGVIADTARFHAVAWKQVADKVNVPWSDDLSEDLKGISRMESLELILSRGGKANEFTEEQKLKMADSKNENYKKLISTLTSADILPGMQDFIKSVRKAGYKTAIASASHNAPYILERLRLDSEFDGIVDPAILKAGKPDPEIFQKAAELMNLQPSAVIGLEDASAGIESINAAGETSLGIGDKRVLNAADLLFANTEEVTLNAIKTQLHIDNR
ncbi:MAG: beta-phosphoglucomutase [Micrococcaceae bacterium]